MVLERRDDEVRAAASRDADWAMPTSAELSDSVPPLVKMTSLGFSAPMPRRDALARVLERTVRVAAERVEAVGVAEVLA